MGGLWSLGIWFVVNVSLTLLLKSSFDDMEFHYPFLLSALHMAVCQVFSFIAIYFFNAVPQPPKASDYALILRGVFPFSLLFSLNIALSNVSLSFVSVSLHQVVKSSIPASSLFLSYLLLGERFDAVTICSLVPIILGVAIAPLGEISFDLFGFCLSLLGNFASSLKVVTSAFFLDSQTTDSIHPISLLYLMAPYSFAEQVFLGWCFGEVDALWHWPRRGSLSNMYILFLTAILAFLINWSNFSVVQDTSPLTLSVAGNTKNVVTIFISIVVSQAPVTMIKLAGIILTCSGAAAYSYVRYMKAQSKKKAESIGGAAATGSTGSLGGGKDSGGKDSSHGHHGSTSKLSPSIGELVSILAVVSTVGYAMLQLLYDDNGVPSPLPAS